MQKDKQGVKKTTGHTHTHTHTDREQHPRHRHTHAHDKNNTPNEHLPQALINDRRWRGDGAYHLPHPGGLEPVNAKGINRVCMRSLRGKYAKRGEGYGILFICSLFWEYIYLEYVRIHVILQGSTGGIQYSYSCGCASEIREYVFNL